MERQKQWSNKRQKKVMGHSKMDNPEKLATQGTQDEGAIKDGQSRETANIGYTRRRKTKTLHNMCWYVEN